MRIDTATIRRLRDALLQSGRRPSAVQSSAYETLARAGLLSDEERAAVTRVDPMAETMFLMMSADGRITASERDAMRGAIRGLTDNLLQDGTIDVMIEEYDRLLDAEGRDARLRHVGESLRGQTSDAEGAFALAAAIALADESIADDERKLVGEIAGRFGITPQRAAQILDQLEEEKR
jgi:tellurite resistance protein